MKKTLALLLALVMLCCAASCFAETAEATALMTLYLNKVSFDGGESYADAAAWGASLSFALYEDGTVSGVSAGDGGETNMVGTWTQDDTGIVTLSMYPEGATEEEAEEMALTMLEDGTIMGTDNENTIYIFGTASADTELPQPVQVEDASALNGRWMFAGVLNGGALTSAEALLTDDPGTADFIGYDGTDPYMTVADGTVTVFGSVLEDFILQGGRLILPLGDEEVDLSVTLDLLDNGCACFTELGIQMLFVPVQ